MTQITLKNPEKQAKLTALSDGLNAKKDALIALDGELKALEGKQAKNTATMSAVKNEFEVEIGKIKAKLETENELSLDDYAETQKLKAELTARVDFFNAVGEELAQKIYDKRTTVYRAKQDFLNARKVFYRFTSLALMDEFIETHKAEIALFKGMFVYSSEYDPFTDIHDRDGYDEFNRVIVEKFKIKKVEVPKNTVLPPLTLNKDWKPKTPGQLHLESFQPKEKNGFERLLENM